MSFPSLIFSARSISSTSDYTSRLKVVLLAGFGPALSCSSFPSQVTFWRSYKKSTAQQLPSGTISLLHIFSSFRLCHSVLEEESFRMMSTTFTASAIVTLLSLFTSPSRLDDASSILRNIPLGSVSFVVHPAWM